MPKEKGPEWQRRRLLVDRTPQLSLHVARPIRLVTEHLQTNDRPNIQTYTLCVRLLLVYKRLQCFS